MVKVILLSMFCAFFHLMDGYGGAQTLDNKLDNYLNNIQKKAFIPGFSVILVSKDGPVFSKAYGIEELGKPKIFSTNTVVPIGSIGKSFTALAIMQLVENGKLQLDKPVVNYLPWFRTANKDKSDLITVRMLLNNTSGLYWKDQSPSNDISEEAMEKAVEGLQSVFLTRRPGESYEYSNIAFTVAGLLINKLSGLSYKDYLRQEIFEPLGMKRTTNNYADLERLNAITGHYYGIEAGIPAKQDVNLNMGEYLPAGLMFHSCANDMGRYLQVLLNGGTWKKKKILSEKSIEEMWQPNVEFPGLSQEDGGDGSRLAYGLGWMKSRIEDREIVHHGGSRGTASSFTMIDRTNGVAASILMNIDMTFIDKYAYPTPISILNNILRLSVSLPISDYGIPTKKDPTLNDFELDEEDKALYIGNYKFKSGRDLLVYNRAVDMKIELGPEGSLVASIYRKEQVVNQFVLDFVNESFALSRSMSWPSHLRFKLTPSKKVTGAWFNSMDFVKEWPEYERAVNKIVLENLGISFELPKTWDFKYSDNGFVATNIESNKRLVGMYMDKDKSFEMLLKEVVQPVRIDRVGLIQTESYGDFSWKIQSFSCLVNQTQMDVQILRRLNVKNNFCLVLLTPTGELTKDIQKVINPMLLSMR